jgi:hypothetical protein
MLLSARGTLGVRRPNREATTTPIQWLVVRYRGAVDQEGQKSRHWTHLSCHRFRAGEVRLLGGVIAYNLGNLPAYNNGKLAREARSFISPPFRRTSRDQNQPVSRPHAHSTGGLSSAARSQRARSAPASYAL